MRIIKVAGLFGVVIPAVAMAASVELTAFGDKSFCERAAKFFGDHLVSDAELSKTVEWTPVEMKGEGPKTRRCSSLDKTRMDLNNDGQEDLVIKATFCMKGVPSDSLYVFPTDSPVLEHTSWQDMSPLVSTQDKFERTGGTYPMTALPMEKMSSSPVLISVFAIQPFRLDGVAYLSLTDARREWMVIAKYQGGERFEDQCYLHAGKF